MARIPAEEKPTFQATIESKEPTILPQVVREKPEPKPKKEKKKYVEPEPYQAQITGGYQTQLLGIGALTLFSALLKRKMEAMKR